MRPLPPGNPDYIHHACSNHLLLFFAVQLAPPVLKVKYSRNILDVNVSFTYPSCMKEVFQDLTYDLEIWRVGFQKLVSQRMVLLFSCGFVCKIFITTVLCPSSKDLQLEKTLFAMTNEIKYRILCTFFDHVCYLTVEGFFKCEELCLLPPWMEYSEILKIKHLNKTRIKINKINGQGQTRGWQPES